MGAIVKDTAKLFEGRERVARSPRDGLWYGIDPVLRCPTTAGHKDRAGAAAEWRDFEARGLLCSIESRRGLGRV